MTLARKTTLELRLISTIALNEITGTLIAILAEADIAYIGLDTFYPEVDIVEERFF